MKFLVVLSVALACVAADVSHLESQAPILKSDYEISPEGAFNYGYETGNGIAAQASGAVRNVNGEYPTLEVQGGYKYVSPEGIPIQLSYVANENGYQPASDILPTPHPIPEAIARSLAYIAAHPPAAEYVAKAASIAARPPAAEYVVVGNKRFDAKLIALIG